MLLPFRFKENEQLDRIATIILRAIVLGSKRSESYFSAQLIEQFLT
jgi:hypothetical protein